MFSKEEIITIASEQLAIECNCYSGNFDNSNNIITTPAFSDKRRKFFDKPFFFKMATMGKNAVISADERLHEWLYIYIKNKSGHWLFEHTNLREIDKNLSLYGKQLFQTHHMFLPIGSAKTINLDVEIKWFEQEDIHQFYNDKRFSNAYCEKFFPERPDVLGIAAIENGKIIGMAGCSADTPFLWQIGIDIDEEYRSKGIGSYLVNTLKNEIISRGKIPYYGTSLSNLHSWNIALNCGFVPSWVEVETQEF